MAARYCSWAMHSGIPRGLVGGCQQYAAESAEARFAVREQRDDDHRRHRSEQSGREVPDTVPGRRPGADGAHVPGFELPGGTTGRSTCMRNVQGGTLAGYRGLGCDRRRASRAGVGAPGLRSTHKPWWECNTGITYLPGSKNATVPSPPLLAPVTGDADLRLEQPQCAAVYIRTFGLPGGQPAGNGRDTDLAARRDLGARASQGCRTTGARRRARTTSSATASTRLGRR